jgi:hypothetical protein
MWVRLSAQHLQNTGENQHILQQLTSRLLKEETMAKRFNRGQQDSLDATSFDTNSSPAPSESRSSTQGRGGR